MRNLANEELMPVHLDLDCPEIPYTALIACNVLLCLITQYMLYVAIYQGEILIYDLTNS